MDVLLDAETKSYVYFGNNLLFKYTRIIGYGEPTYTSSLDCCVLWLQQLKTFPVGRCHYIQ